MESKLKTYKDDLDEDRIDAFIWRTRHGFQRVSSQFRSFSTVFPYIIRVRGQHLKSFWLDKTMVSSLTILDFAKTSSFPLVTHPGLSLEQSFSLLAYGSKLFIVRSHLNQKFISSFRLTIYITFLHRSRSFILKSPFITRILLLQIEGGGITQL